MSNLGKGLQQQAEDGQDELLLNTQQGGKGKKKQLGAIKYRIEYDFLTSTLTVTVIEGKVGQVCRCESISRELKC